MMERLSGRAEAIARLAQRRRLEQIAAAASMSGVVAEVGADGIVLHGGRLVRRWLADPLLRFMGRSRP